MDSLYDVFSAIRDDEGDHVSTMEACLDPTVAKLSPSLERKVLTGIATAAAIALFLNTGADFGDFGTDVVDGIDLAVDDTVATSVVDAVIAGVAGIASQLGQETEEAIMEEGLILNFRAFVTELVSVLSRLF